MAAEGAGVAALGKNDAIFFDADVDVIAFSNIKRFAKLGRKNDATEIIDFA